LKHHPDKGGDELLFKEIVEAYETLSDEDKRRNYDLKMKPRKPNFQSFDPHMFMNAGMRFNQKRYKHPPTEKTIVLSLEDVMYGVKKKMIVKTYIPCSCREMCKMCEGEGMRNEIHSNGRMMYISKVACDKCFTKGWNISMDECEVCQGNRQYEKQDEYTLDISPGVQEGSKLVFEGKGQQAFSKSEIAGDLIFLIKIEESKDIKIKGIDLEKEIQIELYDTMLGKDIEIKYGKEIVKINTFEEFGIVEKGVEYRIKGRGIQMPDNSQERGDLIILFKIVYPPIEEMIKLRQMLIKSKYEI
jgi:DnaJ-class molecular chaperone